MQSSYRDHFSAVARQYAEYRPGYPDALFAWLATLTPQRDLAWDCATGNGQAAIGLVPYFARIVASDASPQQIANRRTQASIDYFIARAQASALRGHSCDLVTVAQSAHWFDFGPFYAEVRRVTKPEGAVALWAYEKFRVEPELDRLVDRFYSDVIGAFWPPERRFVEEGYRTLPFPLNEVPAPRFELQTQWTLEQVVRYLGTWSAVQRFVKQLGFDPVGELAAQLAVSWGDPAVPKCVRWPVHLRVGRL